MTDLAAAVAEELARVRARIEAAGGDPAAVRIVAVTKGHGVEAVRAAVAAGAVDLGESYAQELVGKAEAIDLAVRWHMIGRLQRNKVRHVAPFVHLWQSIDRLSLAAEVVRQVEGISFTFFKTHDVVRHALVARILDAYEAFENR